MKTKVYTVIKENTMLKEELQRLLTMVQENEAKHKGFRLVEDAFLTSESIEEIDTKALAYMEEIFEIDRVALYLDKNAFKFGAHLSEASGRIIYTDEKVLRYAYVEKRPYFGTYLEGLISDFHLIDNIGSYLIAPITENGKIVGSLNLYSTSPEKLAGEMHADFVKELLLRVGITLRKLHNKFIIVHQAQYDFLTGVYNKSMMHALLHRYIDRYNETGQGFTFVLTDMDNFKLLNDTHGHIVGDEILKTVADEFKILLKPEQAMGRFGGDEFYLIFNDTDPNVVVEQFGRISAIVAKAAAKYHMEGVLTISGGYVCIPNDLDLKVNDAVDIVKLADMGLYHSKALGKSVCSASCDVKK